MAVEFGSSSCVNPQENLGTTGDLGDYVRRLRGFDLRDAAEVESSCNDKSNLSEVGRVAS